MKDHFMCFARNERWGSCVDCPRSNGHVYPEFCIYKDRYDHTLSIDDLGNAYRQYKDIIKE